MRSHWIGLGPNPGPGELIKRGKFGHRSMHRERWCEDRRGEHSVIGVMWLQKKWQDCSQPLEAWKGRGGERERGRENGFVTLQFCYNCLPTRQAGLGLGWGWKQPPAGTPQTPTVLTQSLVVFHEFIACLWFSVPWNSCSNNFFFSISVDSGGRGFVDLRIQPYQKRPLLLGLEGLVHLNLE